MKKKAVLPCKNSLTKEKEECYNRHTAKRGLCGVPVAFEGGKGKKRELPEKREKTFGKKFEKRLDKAGGMWYSI